ncbi:MAG: PKD domain-containing protein, partial [Planctomycetaceae bacterium]|nr:PKD domain-containing protein [Planctomycetaceae bacterium]
MITWTSLGQDGSGSGVYGQRYDANGTAIGGEFQVNVQTARSQANSSVAMTDSGEFVVTWDFQVTDDGLDYDVYARRFDVNGNALGDEFLVNTYNSDEQFNPSISMADSGEFVITWASFLQGIVYGQHYDANGNAIGDEFQVNAVTGFIPSSHVSLNNAGQFVVVWTNDGQDGDANGVFAQRFSLDVPPLVAVGHEQQINTYTTGNQQTTTFRVPSVAIAKNGDYVVTWSSDVQDGSNTGVYAQRFDANGNALGSEFQVNTYTTGSQNNPAIAMSESGEFVIVWNGDGQGGFGIHGQRFDADGNPLGSEFQVNSYLDSQTHVTVAMSDSGDFVIAWSSGSQDGDQYGIFAQRYDANGNAIGGDFQVNTYTVGRQWFPSVSIAATGEFVIVWTSDFQDGDDRGVYAQRYDADGNTVGGEFRVTTTTADRQYTPYVSMANTGEFVVAWASNNQDGDLLGIFAQRYAADGSPVGDEFLVNKTTLGIQALPSVSMANTGEFVITWESYNQGGNDWGIFGQRYDADGNALGDEFQVNTNTASDQRYPSIALNDAGQFVVAWTDTAQDGSGNGVYAQRYRILYEPPSVAVDSASVSVDEGNTAANTGTYSDAEGFAVTLTASVGTVLNNGDGTWSWSWDTSDGPDDSQTVTITATSVRGLSTDTTFDLTVQNVAPVITGVGDTSTTPGSPITITANITDAGVDTPFSIVWDMGDGTFFNDLTEVTHTYAAGGEYFASLTVTDSDGAETTKDFRVVIAPPVTITASQTVLEEAAIIPVGTEHQVNSTTLGDQTTEYITPSNVAVAGNGDYVITWVSYDGNGQGVFAQRFDANGNSLGGEFQVNTYTTSNQLYSSVAMATSGEFIITWSSLNQDGSGYGIYAQRYDANGNTVGGEFRVNTYTANYQIYSTVSIAETGAFVITWSSDGQDGDGNGVYARLYDASGNPVGGEFRVNTYTVSSQSIPAVSMTDTGNFIITWSSFQDGNGFGVYAQRYDAGGTRIGSEFQVNTHTAGDQLWPSVSMVDSGKFVITWSSSDQDGSSWGIYAQRYDAVGNALGSEFQVNTYTHSFQSRSSASMTDSGDFLVTWDSYGQDGSDLGVYAQAYDGQGNLLGTEIRVNTYTQSAQYAASVSNNGTGQFVVTWSSALQDGSGYGVYAQRFALTSSDVDVFATIDNPLSEDVVIPLTYTGTAIPDVDFEQVGQPGVAPTQIVIPAGQTSGSVTIRNVADSLDEDVESLSIHFGVPSNASLASADPINIQLLDDDAEPAVFLSSVGQTLHEQDLSLPVTVSLSEVSGRDVTVNLSTSGTATLGMDYTFDNPVVVIPAGQLSAGTVLQLLDDTVGEGAEQIQVQIDSADYATVPATPGQPASLTHLINLNDTPTMQFASVLRQVSETDGTYNVLLTLSNESTSPITTTITLSGDATIGDDYTSALGTIFDVTFDPGETEKTISVTLVNDETQEADKSLLFQTTNLFGSTIT